tara:strand:- start:109 stop:270 length:162 start_codon:yes stop_codon:yes gene_type:complete
MSFIVQKLALIVNLLHSVPKDVMWTDRYASSLSPHFVNMIFILFLEALVMLHV